jgi:hypothetical protein
MSISGTVVRNQSEEPETPRSSRSRLGIQEKPSNASLEDSAINLAEVMHMNYFVAKFSLVWSIHNYNALEKYMQAKAALQAGFRKGNARERPVINKHEKESHEPRFSGVNSHEVRRYLKLSLSTVLTCSCVIYVSLFNRTMFFVLVRMLTHKKVANHGSQLMGNQLLELL